MVETSWTEPKVAQEDIVTYKLVYVKSKDDGNIECKSSVFGTVYTLGEMKDEEELVLDGPYNDVTEGYPEFWNVTSGYASYKEKPTPYSEGMCVAECVIPRGAKYFEDQTGTCYASSVIAIDLVLTE